MTNSNLFIEKNVRAPLVGNQIRSNWIAKYFYEIQRKCLIRDWKKNRIYVHQSNECWGKLAHANSHINTVNSLARYENKIFRILLICFCFAFVRWIFAQKSNDKGACKFIGIDISLFSFIRIFAASHRRALLEIIMCSGMKGKNSFDLVSLSSVLLLIWLPHRKVYFSITKNGDTRRNGRGTNPNDLKFIYVENVISTTKQWPINQVRMIYAALSLCPLSFSWCVFFLPLSFNVCAHRVWTHKTFPYHFVGVLDWVYMCIMHVLIAVAGLPIHNTNRHILNPKKCHAHKTNVYGAGKLCKWLRFALSEYILSTHSMVISFIKMEGWRKWMRIQCYTLKYIIEENKAQRM